MQFLLADGRTLEFVFEDFPQKVCSLCDERYYEAKDLIAAEDAVTRDLMARGIRDSAVFKYLRKAVGLKATELADLLGVTAETVSRWENGHNEADRAVWAALHHHARPAPRACRSAHPKAPRPAHTRTGARMTRA